MRPVQNPDSNTHEISLRAKLRMSYFLLLLFVIHIVEAYITFPFVDHTDTVQNVVYGFVVAAPFYTINILFIILTRRDLSAIRSGRSAS
jgi:FtsH-binding integral membrane protein